MYECNQHNVWLGLLLYYFGLYFRTVISESPADGETSQFLAKQDILWKGFLNMLTVAKFVTKGYLVSGSADILKAV